MDPLDDLFEKEPAVTAVILAGGQGTRMRPYEGAKALVPIAGKMLIQRLIEGLQKEGVEHFHVCLGYKAEEVEKSCRSFFDGEQSNLTFSNAGENVTMGRRLELAVDAVQTPHMLICYGDTLADVSVSKLRREMERNEAVAVFAAAQVRSEFGLTRTVARRIDGELSHRLAKIDEKPLLQEWASIGFVLCHHWAGLRLNARWSVVDWLNELAKDDTVIAHRHSGFHYTVNTERDLHEVTKVFETLTRRTAR